MNLFAVMFISLHVMTLHIVSLQLCGSVVVLCGFFLHMFILLRLSPLLWICVYKECAACLQVTSA